VSLHDRVLILGQAARLPQNRVRDPDLSQNQAIAGLKSIGSSRLVSSCIGRAGFIFKLTYIAIEPERDGALSQPQRGLEHL